MADRKKITAPELPPEILLFQILPRLPAKSLLRFKCVCKQWRSFLTTPLFAKIQLHRATTVDYHEKLIFCIRGSTSRCKFLTIDCEDGLIAPPRYCPFPGNTAATITSSVNGLACVDIWNNAKALSDLILWNPLTDEYKTLPRPVDGKCYSIPFFVHELCYTCTDDDYKILRINVDGKVYIYSLKSDSWRNLESKLDNPGHIPYVGDHHNLLDEKLHLLMYLGTRYVIIRLDLKTEKFTKIAVPSTCPNGSCLKFVVVKGCIRVTICKVDFFSGTWTIEEWQLDGDGSWMKVVNSICSVQDSSFLGPMYLLRNGNWVMCNKEGICKVDPKKNVKKHLSSSSPFIGSYQVGICIETFVSPNQYLRVVTMDQMVIGVAARSSLKPYELRRGHGVSQGVTEGEKSTDDDYKILRINADGNVYIYSLKYDSWRKLESKMDYPERIPYAGDHHNLLDEKLHFLVIHRTRNLIIRLDLKTKRFTKIAVPSTCRDGILRFMVVKGCIHLTIFKADLSSRTWTIEEWRMDGDGSWTKVVNSICSIQDSSFLGPLYLTRNGNWLMSTKNGIGKVDPKKNAKDHLSSSTPLAVYQKGIYIETFVSPNQYTH
ncbi:hypothetical protein OSB04_012563 [Centaurea solstitialis]|uniref:F-box domain-containing protein n=1 Tax=Centaurea solstitialis TaxID=347529 RepID=A0AA38TDB5_9ASTR|nr:hypothetical protein OSB04_012563 [Centaurea solstitialis]